MSFVVHENHGPHKYTRIHRAGPKHVRYGGYRTMNTRWHPLSGDTYATYVEAHAAAVTCGHPHGPLNCKWCKPQWDIELEKDDESA